MQLNMPYVYIIIGSFFLGLIIGFTLFFITKGKLKNITDYLKVFDFVQENIEKVEEQFAPIVRIIGNNKEYKDSVNENKENTVKSNVIKYEDENGIKHIDDETITEIIEKQVDFSKMQTKYKK